MKPFRTSWRQFQGDSDNSGYAAVATGLFDHERWTEPVESAGGGSPAIDPFDGSIYLTNAIGQLTKYRALNGVQIWSRAAATNLQWGTTPAVDSAGRVYALFSNLQTSILVCYDRDGNELWTYTIPGPSTPDHRALLRGSPKVWNQSGGGALIAVHLCYQDHLNNLQYNQVLVLNHLGFAFANYWISTTFIFTAHGSGGFSARLPVALPASHARLFDERADVPPIVSDGVAASLAGLPKHVLWEPTCALIDGPNADFPTIIATDSVATVVALGWQERGLTKLWSKTPSRDGFPHLTPPAVLPNGLVAIGCSDEELKLLDPATGASLHPWPNLGGPIYGTPASFLRHIFVTTMDGDVVVVDSNGTLKRKVNVGGQIKSSAVVTATHVYVTAANGIYAFDHALNKLHTYATQPAGVSSFAVSDDGAVYVVAGDLLRRFDAA